MKGDSSRLESVCLPQALPFPLLCSLRHPLLPTRLHHQEYLPISRAVACNELLLLQHLCGDLPEDKYSAAAASAAGPSGSGRPLPRRVGQVRCAF